MTRPLVLLHPLGVNASFWSPVLEYFAGIETHALNLPGHGGIPPLPRGASLAEWSSFVVGELDRAGVQVADLVGVSLGGLVAQELAALSPGRVGRLILVDTVHTYPPAMRDVWRQRAGVARAAGMADLVDPTLGVWFSEDFLGRRGPTVEQTAASIATTSPEGYARACELLESVDTEPMLAQITCPVLIVCGDHDTEPFRESARLLVDRIADARLEWLPGQHAAAIEHPQDFAVRLQGFLGLSTRQAHDSPITGGVS